MPANKKFNIEKYNLNPKVCLCCNIALPYDKRFNDFCSTSCGAKYTNIRNGHSLTNEKIDAKLSERNIKRLDDHINIHNKVRWQCLLCDNVWTVTADNILSRGKGCPVCFNSPSSKLNNGQIDERLNARLIKRIDNYIDSHAKIRWECLVCNYIWSASPRCVINLESGCPICNIPGSNERLLLKLLNENNILCEPQFSIKKLDPDLPAYRIDVFIPMYKIAIEYNGKQHYEKTRFGSKCTEKDFGKQVARDDFVRSICVKYDINLIEIDGRKYHGKKRLTRYIIGNIIPLINNGANLDSTEQVVA